MERNSKLTTGCLLWQAFGAGIVCSGLISRDFQLGILGGDIIAVGLGVYLGLKTDLEQDR